MWQAHHTRHQVSGHLDWGNYAARPTCYSCLASIGDAQARSVVRRDLQRAGVTTFHQGRQVVHERIAGTQVPPPDKQHLFGYGRTGDVSTKPRQIVNHRERSKLDLSASGVDDLAQTWLQRSKVNAVGGVLDPLKRQSRRVAPETVAVRTKSQQHIDNPLRPNRVPEARDYFLHAQAFPVAVVLHRGLRQLRKDAVVKRFRLAPFETQKPGSELKHYLPGWG